MPSLNRTAPLVPVIAACLLGCAAEPPKPTPAQIAQWVRQLGDDDFSVREDASKQLYEAGPAAEEAVEEAAGSDDPEVVRRANALLDKFRWGLYADAPKKVVDTVTRYRTADANGKVAVVQELLDAGPDAYPLLFKIAGAEPDPTVRQQIYPHLAREVKRLEPQMLLDGNDDTLRLLLDVVLANDEEQGIQDYAAYWMKRGKLDERIAHFKVLAGRGRDAPRCWEIVAHLCHAKGDLAAAREAAEKAEKPQLADALLFEAGDWKALAARPVHGNIGTITETLGFQAAYRRLAGDAKGCDDALAELRKLADVPGADAELRFHFAKALFLNDRPAQGVDVLVNTPDRQIAAFELLAAQMRYKEALGLADKAMTANAPEAPALEVLKARTLYSLGEKDTATQIFARRGDEIKEGADFGWFETLIESEYRVGLKDQAFQHAAKLLSTSKDGGWPGRLFPKLFPKNGDAAEGLWAVVRAMRPGQTPSAALKDLRGMLDGTADPKTVADLAGKADGLESLSGVEVQQWRLALAEAALATKQDALAGDLLESAGSADALVRRGDLDADKKEWDKAAVWYARAWEKGPGRALALYLDGWALVQAGKEAEGKKRMEAAHWVPLGDGQARLAFLQSLWRRGRREAVGREAELLVRLSPAGSEYATEGLRQVGLDALQRKDYAAAAAGQERSMLCCLNENIIFPQTAAYLGMPAFVHRLRAQGCTAAGKIDEARKEAALCLTCLPGDTAVPIELVPAWEKAGRKKEAAELFDQCIAAQEKICAAYPNCSWAHNSVAWVSACCRRNLESAQEHALKSVALTPASAGNLDTLAEVYFQRGDKDKAVVAEKKAADLAPQRAYFREQLKRIEAGDPSADRPAEDDEE